MRAAEKEEGCSGARRKFKRSPKDVVAVLVSSASTTGEAEVGSTESRPTEEETEIGGS